MHALADAVVSRLFAALRANYGSAFDRQWECPAGVDPKEHALATKAHWARELAGYANHLEAIAYALENLPEQPPNLPAFKAICRRAPAKQVPRLESPKDKADPKAVAAAIAAVQGNPLDPKAWAIALRDREREQRKNARNYSKHEQLTQAQRHAWRQALGLELTTEA
jgi:hypothetical protein